MADSYVCSGAMMKCTMGTCPAKLTVLPVRTVFLTGQPMANISDHLTKVNLAPFGLCRSMGFPATASATAAALGTLTPMPCMHNTPFPWMGGKNDYLVQGQPALLKSSTCQCMWGGTICIIDDGQHGEGVQYVQKKQKEKIKGYRVSKEIFKDAAFPETIEKTVPPPISNNNIHKKEEKAPILLEYQRYNECLSSFMNQAKDIGPDIQNQAEQIAQKYGARCTPINYKTEVSIRRKTKNDLEELYHTKDLVRTTIVVPDSEKKNIVIEKILLELGQQPNLDRIKIQRTEKDPLGYNGNIVNVIGKNGLTAEIQVNTESMIYAKEKDAEQIIGSKAFERIKNKTGLEAGKGHKYYEEWRDMPLDCPERAIFEKESQEYYSHFLNNSK